MMHNSAGIATFASESTVYLFLHFSFVILVDGEKYNVLSFYFISCFDF